MTLHPNARHGAEALSSQVKANVLPIEKPAKREKATRGLSRKSQMERKSSKLKRGHVGYASQSQKGKVLAQGCRLTGHTWSREVIDPAHVTPRGVGGCDDPECVIGLVRDLHEKYDRGELDILPYLTLEEQAHAVSHLGILGALKRTTGENYVPESQAVMV